MDKTPSYHYQSHLGWIGGNSRHDATNNVWQLAQKLEFRVLKHSAIEIYNSCYRTMTSGEKFRLPLNRSPFEEFREPRNLVEGPPPPFSPISEEKKRALHELVCPGSISSPQLLHPDEGNGNNGLGGLESYMQPRANESLGDGGVEGIIRSPDPSGTQPAGVDAHEGVEATPDGFGVGVDVGVDTGIDVGGPSIEETPNLESPSKPRKRPLSTDEGGPVRKKYRPRNCGTLRCGISSACIVTFTSTRNRAGHYRRMHAAEYARLQADGTLPLPQNKKKAAARSA
jgi:hypothetical protein